MELNRAYSLFEIKAIDEDKRIIEGVATTPSTDRVGDVVNPLGGTYQLPLAFLWQHRHSEPVGHVLQAKPTRTGINCTIRIAKTDEPGRLKDRLDEAWQSLKLMLVRGLSIGFNPTKWSFQDDGGIYYDEWEWLELSAVTIPANADCTITSIKQFDVGAPAAPGRPAPPTKPAPGISGIPKALRASIPIAPKEGTKMTKTTGEQIADLEVKRAATAAGMQAVMQKSMDAGRSTDAAEQEEFDNLEAELDALDGDLKRLKSLEKIQAQQAKAVDPVVIRSQEDGARVRSGIEVKRQAKLPPGIEFARAVKCFGMAKGIRGEAISIAKNLYGEDANVIRTLQMSRGDGDGLGIEKAEVSAGANISGNWADDLVGAESSAYADFVAYLRPMTIIGKFGEGGIPNLRRVPFRVPLITQTQPGEGYWVGEGKPKPLTSFGFSRTTLSPLKVANIAVLTKEMIRDSSPSADIVVRDELANALKQRLDIDFVNPAKAASAGVSPASITNNVDFVVSTGDDADDIRLDVRAVMQKFVDANNPLAEGVWIMSTTNALALSMMVNPLGQPEFKDITMKGGTFFGLPVIVSEHVGSVVVLMNASDIYFADEGGISIDMSTEASLEMLDSSLLGSAVTDVNAVSLVSMFQTGSVAFLAERALNWARRRNTSVAYLSSVNWGGAVPVS